MRAFGAGTLVASIIAFVLAPLLQAADPPPLSLAQRIAIQRTIDRWRYSHQSGTSVPFEQAVPEAVSRNKVLRYLKQSVALERVWEMPVTRDALLAEARRIAHDTKSPDRLRELFALLENDSTLIVECLARPLLVDRLSRAYFEMDPAIHAEARARADRLRVLLLQGSRRALPGAEFSDVVIRKDGLSRQARDAQPPDDLILEPDAFDRRRRAVQEYLRGVSPVLESSGEFTVEALIEESPERLHLARYRVAKKTWEAWWDEISGSLDENEVEPIAGSSSPLDVPAGVTASCAPDAWEGGTPGGDVWPLPRRGHTAVWTGTEMVIWGGLTWTSSLGTSTGVRYDPVTDTATPVSAVGAPSARENHRAVWTGSRMMVWGGFAPVGYVNSGALYDPQTDTWSPVTTVGAASPRKAPQMVWTGSRVIVWGGYGPGGGVNQVLITGALYDPQTDAWSSMSPTGAPSLVYWGHTIWTGTQIIAWGLSSDGVTPGTFNAGGRYNPQTDTWSGMTTSIFSFAPTPRQYSVAVWTGTRMIVWGGHTQNGPESSGAAYNPVNDSWSATPLKDAPPTGTPSNAVWTGSRMIVWGGGVNTGGIYNPQNNRWSPTSVPPALSARDSAAAVWTGSLMVMWGGREGERTVNTALRYDPAADSWMIPAPLSYPIPRRGHTVVWTGNEMIVWGGEHDFYHMKEGYRFDPVTDAWTPTNLSEAPAGRAGHVGFWTGDQMLIWGGSPNGPGLPVPRGSWYDPVADTWVPMSEIASLPSGYSYLGFWTGSRMHILGRDPFSTITVAARYDPQTNTWSSMPGVPGGFGGGNVGLNAAVAWTGAHLVLWGGQKTIQSVVSYVNTGAQYDPVSNTWQATSTVGAPEGRELALAGTTGGRMVVWAGRRCNQFGQNCVDLSSGGVYQPSTGTWAPMSELNSPGTRSGASVVDAGDQMLVWSGSVGGALTQTGASYNPASDAWTPMATTGAPAARVAARSAFTGSAAIVWGGSGADSSWLADGGFYHLTAAVLRTDDDADGMDECAGDCDDASASVFPGAPQLCDGLNNDCIDPLWPALPANEVDGDGDGASACTGDCDDTEPGLLHLPDDVRDLNLSLAGATLSLDWTPPADPGASQILYDVLRAPGDPSALSGDAVCLETDESDLSAADAFEPAPGTVLFYVVRAQNGCGAGPATIGSDGQPLAAIACP